MKIVFVTQVYENLGARDWDGTGECPQYWKPTVGHEYIVENVPEHVCNSPLFGRFCDQYIPLLEQNKPNWREFVICRSAENDSYVPESEQNQLNCNGKVTVAEFRIQFDEACTKLATPLK